MPSSAGTSSSYASSLYLHPMQLRRGVRDLPGQLPAVRPDADAGCGAAGVDAAERPALPAEPVHAVLGPGARGVGRSASRPAGSPTWARRAAPRQLRGELAAVRKLPDGLGYFSEREGGRPGRGDGRASPDEGQFFALGGGTLFRGFDLAERQGSFLWVANAELRLPLCAERRVERARQSGRRCGTCTLAGFYDVGAVYANGRSVGGVAHALGAGLRLDLAVLQLHRAGHGAVRRGQDDQRRDPVPVLVRRPAPVLTIDLPLTVRARSRRTSLSLRLQQPPETMNTAHPVWGPARARLEAAPRTPRSESSAVRPDNRANGTLLRIHGPTHHDRNPSARSAEGRTSSDAGRELSVTALPVCIRHRSVRPSSSRTGSRARIERHRRRAWVGPRRFR